MAKFVNAGECIECEKSFVAIRKINSLSYIKMDCIDGVVRGFFRYKSKINSIVQIIEELTPKNQIINNTSHLDLHDLLEADSIEIMTTNMIKKFEYLPNFTNVHGIQGKRMSSFTYAKISLPFRLFLERSIN